MKDISLAKPVGQRYDGAASMNGCYNSFHEIIRQNVGEHVPYIHCYTHVLKLEISDSATIEIDTANLFQRLETWYAFFWKSQQVRGYSYQFRKNIVSQKIIL